MCGANRVYAEGAGLACMHMFVYTAWGGGGASWFPPSLHTWGEPAELSWVQIACGSAPSCF
jgi:hypothetical protein